MSAIKMEILNGLITNRIGDKFYYLNDKLHREDGPAIEASNGDKQWWMNGLRHREDGPAVEYSDGYKEWSLNGELHREDGPAVEYPNGYNFWYYHGKQIYVSSNEEFLRLIKLKSFW